MENSSGNNTAVEKVDNNNSPTKKVSKAKAIKSQRSKTLHPPTSEMVNAAIKELKDRKGSSLQAIKKYVATTYKVDGEKLAPFIKRYLKAAVISGAIVQTKGKGASGSFKLSAGKSGSETKIKVQKSVRVIEPKKTKKSVEKKTTSIRKSSASKKPSPAKKTEAAKKSAATKKTSVKVGKAEKTEVSKPVTETKTMSRSKRTTKAPAAKTRTPRPKKAVTSKTVKSATKK